MNITSTVVITTATATTPNSYYELEYSIKENEVVKMQASVHTLPQGVNNEKEHLGYIIFENENLHCSLPNNISYSALFSDFDSFLVAVRAECEKNKAAAKSSPK